MIVVKLYGGIGNQMFQYALGRKLAIKHKTELYLDLSWFEKYSIKEDRPFELKAFNIQASQGKINLRKLKYFKQKQFHYDPSILNLKDNVYLDGYWQSYKYWYDIRNIIQEDFRLKKVKPIKIEKPEHSIGIFFRRGDYVTNPDRTKFHGILSMNYYENAIKYLKKHLIGPLNLLIFSDDPKWATENVHFDFPSEIIDWRNYILPESRSAYSMYLMSTCKHQIIANSSWSWWAAWLNKNPNRIVIAPKRWVTDESINADDIIPIEWVRL